MFASRTIHQPVERAPAVPPAGHTGATARSLGC